MFYLASILLTTAFQHASISASLLSSHDAYTATLNIGPAFGIRPTHGHPPTLHSRKSTTTIIRGSRAACVIACVSRKPPREASIWRIKFNSHVSSFLQPHRCCCNVGAQLYSCSLPKVTHLHSFPFPASAPMRPRPNEIIPASSDRNS